MGESMEARTFDGPTPVADGLLKRSMRPMPMVLPWRRVPTDQAVLGRRPKRSSSCAICCACAPARSRSPSLKGPATSSTISVCGGCRSKVLAVEAKRHFSQEADDRHARKHVHQCLRGATS
jgi:hypothetical protein